MTPAPDSVTHDRRSFMSYFASVGLGFTLLPGVLWARLAAGEEITEQTIACAAEIAGLEFDEDERAMMVQGLRDQEEQLKAIHALAIPNSVAPALLFDPLLPGKTAERAVRDGTPAAAASAKRSMVRSPVGARVAPRDMEELAFLPVTELSELIRQRKVTSVALTRMYLSRLRRLDPMLHAVVNLTEERAMGQAEAADREIAGGKYRGPLHGIPWGAKDLLAVKGTPTTWGVALHKGQMFDEDATVVQRLDAAGAVLVAKLTLGELAMGDRWFGGMTRNPWKLDQGSSGSSAGSAAAVAAGLVGFAVGSETLGSISSPATRVGATGLRPTFGRVPRTGAMALSWSMDKIGPLCRSAEDCALVLDAIHGSDGQDAAVRDAAFNWDARVSPASLRIGYVKSAFERDDEGYPNKKFDLETLGVLRSLGARLIPVVLPEMPYSGMRIILVAEAAAAFDELTRSGRDDKLAQQDENSWPNIFRTARFIPAADYVNANRARTMAMEAWSKLMDTVDVIVVPTFGGSQLVATNLTGHPAVILPNGFRDDGTPVSITFLGGLYEEASLLAVANAYQRATNFHLRHPVLDV